MNHRPSWLYHQVAVVPCRYRQNRVELLLVRSRSHTGWVLPQNIHDPGIAAADCAAVEAFEQAGVKSQKFPHPLGEYRCQRWEAICRVHVFAVLVDTELDRWPGAGWCRREWFGFQKAIEQIHDPRLRDLLEHLPPTHDSFRDRPSPNGL